MPRLSQKSELLEGIQTAIESTAYAYLLASSSEEDEAEEDAGDLLIMHEAVDSERYLSRGESAGRHGADSLEGYIHRYPESAFLSLFRMHRRAFWQLVDVLSKAGGPDYWCQSVEVRGRPARPIYQQIAVGLYVLGGGMTVSKSRMLLNIGHGTTWIYAWRTIDLLARLVNEYIQWPVPAQRGNTRHAIFEHCIGFLDGTIIILRYKPMVDPEAYFSRKKNYGFNLQAVCDWNGRFIWASMGYTASAHDSTAFKSTAFYRGAAAGGTAAGGAAAGGAAARAFDPREYLLADKAYALERHIITPYKEPASRLPQNAAFNKQLSIPRVKIEHAFGMLKARWPTIYDLPIRIGMDQERGHRRVMNWTMACLVLHNFLNKVHDQWEEIRPNIQEDIEAPNQEEVVESNAELQQAGKRRRNELRERIRLLQVQE